MEAFSICSFKSTVGQAHHTEFATGFTLCYIQYHLPKALGGRFVGAIALIPRCHHALQGNEQHDKPCRFQSVFWQWRQSGAAVGGDGELWAGDGGMCWVQAEGCCGALQSQPGRAGYHQDICHPIALCC